MAILNRFTRLLTADIHAVMDRLEEPRAQLQQALRELEEAQLIGNTRLRQLDTQSHQLKQQQSQLEESLTNTQRELSLCLDADQEALAKKVVRRRLQLEQQQLQVDAQIEQLNQQQLSLTAQLQDCGEQQALVSQQIELLPADADHSGGPAGSSRGDRRVRGAITDADVEIALLAEVAQRKAAGEAS